MAAAMRTFIPVVTLLMTVVRGQNVTTASTDTIQYRLMASFLPNEGRLEVRYKGIWGTVCDDNFNDVAATVACRSLGYNYGGEFVGTRFGAGSYGTTIWLDDVMCTGSEQSIDQCSHRVWNSHDCTHTEDTSIVCRETDGSVTESPLNTTKIRLTSGPSEREGRLLVYRNNTWGSVCYYGFSTIATRVVCNSLGFGRIGQYSTAPYEIYTSYGRIWWSGVQCNGTESSIFECAHTEWVSPSSSYYSYCSHYQDIYITCIPTARLVGGSKRTEGRLEVYRNGAWGTVCGHLFDDNAASVACNEIGLGRFGHTLHTRYGPGTGEILMDDVNCIGTEYSLSSCSYSSWVSSYHCNHSSDVSIACYNRTQNLTDQLRLADGDNDREGRLEIFHNGIWGTVCDVNFNITNVKVACNKLSFGFVGQMLYNYFGPGSGRIWLSNVTCNGTEKSLADCSHAAWGTTYGYTSRSYVTYYSCYHNNDVSISCYNSSRSNLTTIRLSGGPSNQEGRLEIRHNGQWGTVCDDYFDDADAHVACFSLGFGYIGSTLSNKYGAGNGTIWLDNLACVGYETSLEQCSHNGWGYHNCLHSQDVSIACVVDNSTDDLNYRLVNGPSNDVGRLEVRHSGLWGTVCDDGFDDNDASVACYSLGFGRTGRTLGNLYGGGTGRIWLDDLGCTGYENSLGECRHSGWGVHNCGHYEDVSISCQNTTGRGIRLSGSTSTSSGRLEIYHAGQWGTVCNDAFDDVDAAVACYSLGFGRAGVTRHKYYGSGQYSLPIWLDGVQCSGTESSLGDCQHKEWGQHDCDHSQDVSITCTANATTRPWLSTTWSWLTTAGTSPRERTSSAAPRTSATTTTVTTNTPSNKNSSTASTPASVSTSTLPYSTTTASTTKTTTTTTATASVSATIKTTTVSTRNESTMEATNGTSKLEKGSSHGSSPTVAIVLGVLATLASVVAVILLAKYIRTRQENALLRSSPLAMFRSRSESSDGILNLNADDDVECLLAS